MDTDHVQGKTVLVTGGAGFIGSHLVERLLRDRCRVVVVDDFSSGRTKIAGVKYHCLDVGSYSGACKLKTLIAEAHYVFHLAGRVGVKNCYENPDKSFETNVIGSHNVLRACIAMGAPMLDVSSSSVYGKADNKIVSEESDVVYGDPGNPSWQYGMHKAIAEAEARNAGMVAVRFFNVIGPRQRGDYGFVVPKFIEQLLHGKPVTVYGDGTQTRSFADVRDVVDGLLLVACNGQKGEVYNLGDDQEYEIKNLAQTLASILGRKCNIQYVSREEAIGKTYQETAKRLPDLSKIKTLGYEPNYSLEDTIRWIAREEYGWTG